MANQFLPFGTGGGANVMSQADYNALGARTAGFAAGIAQSAQLNKVWRQSAFAAAVLMEFSSVKSGVDALDDGNLSAAVANFESALQAFMLENQQTVVEDNVTFGVGVADGDAVRWDNGSSDYVEGVADGTSNNTVVGFADVTNSRVYLFGRAALFTGLTPGARYYLDGTTPGVISTTPALNDPVFVGTAANATTLFIDIDPRQGNSIVAPAADNSSWQFKIGPVLIQGGNEATNLGDGDTAAVLFPVVYDYLYGIFGQSRGTAAGGSVGPTLQINTQSITGFTFLNGDNAGTNGQWWVAVGYKA